MNEYGSGGRGKYDRGEREIEIEIVLVHRMKFVEMIVIDYSLID